MRSTRMPPASRPHLPYATRLNTVQHSVDSRDLGHPLELLDGQLPGAGVPGGGRSRETGAVKTLEHTGPAIGRLKRLGRLGRIQEQMCAMCAAVLEPIQQVKSESVGVSGIEPLIGCACC